jgi:UDP-glucose 4-epimerase
MARYLVTGGCGFIGSHLTTDLVNSGADVVVLDDLSTGREQSLPERVELVVGDIRDQATVRKALDGCDACFHLAAVASVQRCHRDWARSHDVNLGGTVNIFEAAHRLNEIPVVYASSAAVYGDLGSLPLSESASPAPISAYGVDKLGCEMQARAGGRIFGLPTIGLRFFNVFGPGQNTDSPYSGVVTRFASGLCHQASIEIFGDGEQTRDYIYVADVVRAVRLALSAASADAPVLNICTGKGLSVNQLAFHLFQLRDRDPKLSFRAAKAGDVRHSRGDPRRAAISLGFRTAVPLIEGLEAVLRHIEGETRSPAMQGPTVDREQGRGKSDFKSRIQLTGSCDPTRSQAVGDFPPPSRPL